MRSEDIRAFASRPWARVEAAKDDYWSESQRDTDGLRTLAAGHALFEHARRVVPGYPTADDRARDLDEHVRLKARIEQASHVFAVRRRPR